MAMAPIRRVQFVVSIANCLLRNRTPAAFVVRNLGLETIVVTKPLGELFSKRHASTLPPKTTLTESDLQRADDVKGSSTGKLQASDQGMSYGQWQYDMQEKKDAEEIRNGKLAWMVRMMEPALNLYKRLPLPGELLEKAVGTATARSLVEIATSLRESTAGMQRWSITDITLGLYVLSLRHASEMAVDAIGGELVTTDSVVKEWLYLMELAWGAYMKDAGVLTQVTMLRKTNIIKFVVKSSVMQPAYYIGIDIRHKLVILCIRGTQTIHDLITDLASHSKHAGVFNQETVHYGSLEAARWFLHHEASTLRNCLQKHKGFELLLVGHSLGGSAACLLGLMLREQAQQTLGLSPEQIRVVGIGTPPCVSKVLSVKCKDFTSTLILQDDLIPRMSSASLIRLRNEILMTDWNVVLKEGSERHGVADIVAGTLQAVSSVQDVARKYVSYARRNSNQTGDTRTGGKGPSKEDLENKKKLLMQTVNPVEEPVELFAPGNLFHLCSLSTRNSDPRRALESQDGYVMWKGVSNAHCGRIILSSTMFSDHRCEKYYYALRDVLKGIPSGKLSTEHLSNHTGI